MAPVRYNSRNVTHAVQNYISVIALTGFITRCSSYANRFGELFGLRIIKYIITSELPANKNRGIADTTKGC